MVNIGGPTQLEKISISFENDSVLKRRVNVYFMYHATNYYQ